jgi:hypothetical protein
MHRYSIEICRTPFSIPFSPTSFIGAARIYSLSLCPPVSLLSTLSKVLSSPVFLTSVTLSRFADLIRHGKNHVHVRQDDYPASQPPVTPPPIDAQSDYPWAQPERRQQIYAQPQSQPKRHQQQQPIKAQPATTMQSQQLTREVEKIVREEREAQEKMPVYKGLENFKLVRKMGECAHRLSTGLCR